MAAPRAMTLLAYSSEIVWPAGKDRCSCQVILAELEDDCVMLPWGPTATQQRDVSPQGKRWPEKVQRQKAIAAGVVGISSTRGHFAFPPSRWELRIRSKASGPGAEDQKRCTWENWEGFLA
ncbi:hypothetical protein RvY_06208 [Ramazzottius varieornatus]|uniref:Uncharacterized protein n=1 Tax=Ramazzottius varieornatus TaxID=947166 RepID=A0A1D1UXS3_RAMVA|nr:hypothetical protein RvY_06208 [Ramazzottius varieornatus]